MWKEVCYILNDLGLNNEQLIYIENSNDFIWKVSEEHAIRVIEFFRDKEMTDEEICKLLIDNPWTISENIRRFEILDIMFDELDFSTEERKKIITFNSETYSSNPQELRQIIDYLKTITNSKDEIKNILINNSDYVSNRFENVKKLILEKSNWCLDSEV